MADRRRLVAVVLLILLAGAVSASVHDYSGARFSRKGNSFVLHGGSEGLYASADYFFDSAAGNLTTGEASDSGSAFIRFDKISFRRPETDAPAASVQEGDTMKVHVIVFEVEDRDLVGGSAYGGQRAICCSSDLAKLGACAEGAIIYRQSTRNTAWPHVLAASFDRNSLVATLPSRTIPITKTGMYNMYFVHCNPAFTDLEIEGKTVWKNPTGYIPGRMAPLKDFYGLMSLAYVILSVFWFSQYAISRQGILPLQNCVTLVITLGMLEMALWYFEYAEFNESGVRPKGITFWAVTFGTIKRTVSRMIVLAVAMGYGVVRATLGGLASKVVMLGATFFLASETLELIENVGAVSDLAGKARLLLVFPVAFLDAAFILWIFDSLSKTLDKLQARRLMVKLDMYRKFTNTLAVTVVVSVGWIGYELYFKSTDVFNERWQSAWIIPAFWQMLSFSLLCVICVIWAPSKNSTRYAYDASEDFDRDQTLTLIRPGPFPVKEVARPPAVVDVRMPNNGKTDTLLDAGGVEDKRE